MMKKLSIIFVFSLLLSSVCFGYGNNQTLEIINIKTSGTGTPAIGQYNRIFRAYPGLAYRVPVGVIGGQFPYTFTLSNAPEGMTVSTDGIITWANPQTSASNITIRATDADAAYTEATWSITVTDSTDDFIFVNASYSGTETGSITQPYNSIQDVMDLGSAAANKIVYFRAGTYAVPVYNSEVSNFDGCSLSASGGRAHIFIGHPDDGAVTFSFGGSNADGFEARTVGEPLADIWFEQIVFSQNWRNTLAATDSDYIVFFDIVVDGLSFDDIAGNSGSLYTGRGGVNSYIYIVDCEFDNFTTASMIGSLYNTQYSLFERNEFGIITGSGSGIAFKESCSDATVRKNTFETDNAIGSGNGSYNEYDYVSGKIEFCYNLFKGNTGTLNLFDNQGETWFYRNTFMDDGPIFRNLDHPDSCEGPWVIEGNVFQNTSEGPSYHYTSSADGYLCVTLSNNLTGTSGLVDSSGNLINEEYVGTYGWETTTASPPTNTGTAMTGVSTVVTAP